MNDLDPGAQLTRRLVRVVLPLAVLLFGLPLAAHLYIELRWYRSLGHSELYMTMLTTKLGLGLTVLVLVGLALLLNLRIASRFSQSLAPLYLYDREGIPQINLSEALLRLALPACIAVSILSGLYYDRYYATYLRFAHASPFGVSDPLFGRDIGFYVFRVPFYEVCSSFALWVLCASLLLSAAIYAVRGAVSVDAGETLVHPRARVHLSVLLALVLAVLALRAYLEVFDVLRSTLGPATGASYADVNAKLPALRIKIGVAAVGVLLLLVNATRRDFNLAILAALLYVGAQIGVQVYPDLVHRFSVRPNELERERPFLKYNLDATRAAYGLDAVQERELPGAGTLTQQQIAESGDTIDNVRLWDHKPLLETFGQIQEIRTYYDFSAVDNDRYRIDGQLRQVMLSARELNSDSILNATWINKRFEFTHGYGLTLGPVNETTPEGLPVLLVQDIPPVSHTPSIKVTRPGIYFGELSSDYVYVRTRNREFDHPAGENNVETDYEGMDGIRFDSTLMRLALAIELGSLELLLSDDIDGDSRVLLHRNIKQRLSRMVPFLAVDDDPYLVVRENGTLVWVFDAYTTSDRYPYSELTRDRGINYVRNSVKAVIDAYDGTVALYVADATDPILRTFRSAFPTSFKPLAEMPPDVRAHLRYPQRIFDVQTEMFATYHMHEPELLYNREDQWEIPAITTGNRPEKMEPYYTVMRLPGEKEAEFILMLPFTPKRKDNLAAWMVARSDGDKLGELVVYRFPKDRLVFGPQQVVNRISQDAEIARQISLWDQRGSQAVFGTLLVIPIESSLLYVRPLYLRSEGGKIPELKRVVVAYEKQIAMKASLREALDAIFGRPNPPATPAAALPAAPAPSAGPTSGAIEPSAAQPPAGGSVEAQALEHFERALRAQREGDWTRYGAELQIVERHLRQLATRDAKPAER